MESFGARLKRERQQRKIELDDISVSTKISTRFLRALEEEQFDQLPGGIFNKGFVRAFARHLGIDEEQAVADYVAAVTPSQPEEPLPPVILPRAEPAEKDHAATEIPWGMLALALVVIAFGFAMWGFYSQEKSAREPHSSSPPVSARKAESPPGAPSQSTSTSPVQPANAQSSQPPAQELAPATSSAVGGALPNNQTSSGRFSVVIKAREDSWLFIDADGKEVMHDLLVAPAEKSVEAEKEIVLRAGNMGALELSFNGKKLPSQGDYGEVKTLTFGADGLQPPPPKPAATAPVSQ
jgi:cytoskeleton protein RodZ